MLVAFLAALLTFQNLSIEVVGQKIEIRGFLYPYEENVWVLASEPNLKTCCVGKKKTQVFVEGAFSDMPSGYVVNVQGELSLDPQRGYVLRNAQINKKKS